MNKTKGKNGKRKKRTEIKKKGKIKGKWSKYKGKRTETIRENKGGKRQQKTLLKGNFSFCKIKTVSTCAI